MSGRKCLICDSNVALLACSAACTHAPVSCSACITQHVEARFSVYGLLPVPCIAPSCKITLSETEVATHMTAEVQARYGERTFNAMMQLQDNFVRCAGGCGYGAIVEYCPGMDSMQCPMCAVSTCLACKTRSPHDSSCRDIISALMDELKRPLPAGIVRCPMRKCRQLLSKGDDNCDKIVCPQCATPLCAQCAAPYNGPHGTPCGRCCASHTSMPAASGILTTDNSAHDPKCRHFRRSPSSNAYSARADADAKEFVSEMRRLEKIFGAQLYSSRPSSRASVRSHSPPASIHTDNSISGEFSRFDLGLSHHSPDSPMPPPIPEQVVWMLDSDAPRCLSCDKRFFFPFRRRHHCRACGLIFCSRCCSRFVLHSSSAAVLTCFACQRLQD